MDNTEATKQAHPTVIEQDPGIDVVAPLVPKVPILTFGEANRAEDFSYRGQVVKLENCLLYLSHIKDIFEMIEDYEGQLSIDKFKDYYRYPNAHEEYEQQFKQAAIENSWPERVIAFHGLARHWRDAGGGLEHESNGKRKKLLAQVIAGLVELIHIESGSEELAGIIEPSAYGYPNGRPW